MRISPRYLLPALLLCFPLAAQAIETDGDYWIIHSQGSAGNNLAFVADADPAHISKRAGGVVSLGVHKVYQNTGNGFLTAHEIEVDCAKKRVRIKRADEIDGPMGGVRPVQISSAWQTQPEAWLVKSRDFICQPQQRTGEGMIPIGSMEMLRMIDAVRAYFTVLGREQARAAILKEIDDAFARMPQP